MSLKPLELRKITSEEREKLRYSLDHYGARDNHIAQLGAYADLDTAREAFAAAVRHRPQRYLCLRQGTRVIARHEPTSR